MCAEGHQELHGRQELGLVEGGPWLANPLLQIWMGVKPSLRCFHFAEIKEQVKGSVMTGSLYVLSWYIASQDTETIPLQK